MSYVIENEKIIADLEVILDEMDIENIKEKIEKMILNSECSLECSLKKRVYEAREKFYFYFRRIAANNENKILGNTFLMSRMNYAEALQGSICDAKYVDSPTNHVFYIMDLFYETVIREYTAMGRTVILGNPLCGTPRILDMQVVEEKKEMIQILNDYMQYELLRKGLEELVNVCLSINSCYSE